ncbi:MAG: DNA polymerase III subunit alpha [Fusobacterium sp.]|uniref:DNA polymerase III subunit alpha n=1 Tax=Fusobacterium sp. TaxID=68766 RepID=UPI0026DCC7D7|nr:DNA polymerase III subunit alpha [Fusobacterium sp.]MDO4689676.1 DNA polymerase III subunit alpha [Fusobacterium sp.]
MMDNFVHLNLHTEYSLMDGVSSVDKYLEKASSLGMKAIAVTDYCNMFCAMEFYKKAKSYDIKPIFGMEIAISADSSFDKRISYSLVLLAKNYEAYKNLVKITSEAYRNIEHNKLKISKETLKKYSSNLIALSSSLQGELALAILSNKHDEDLKGILDEYIDIFGRENFFLEIQAIEGEEQRKVNERLYELSLKYDIEMLATNYVHYVNRDEYNLQDVVICIQTGAKLRDKNRKSISSKDLYLKSKAEMEASLDEKYKKAIENTEYVASLCNVDIKFGELQFPYYEVPKEYENMDQYLKEICYTNLKKIYAENLNEEIIKRLDYELSVIYKMGYSGYFIVVWDFINYAKRRNIPVGPGRGSAAGSLVSYTLGITMVDPIKYNLLFERFLNPERISMPDIDIDICRERREELIDYVVQKYGREKVAHIITFGRMKAKAAIRDVGRVLDVDLKKIDHLAKLVPANLVLEQTLKENVEVAKLYTGDIELQKVIDISIKLDNKVRHSSTHAAGILITKENLDELIPIYLDEKEGVVATQYQMKELEDLGLLKIDFLGLKNLSNIQRTIDYIKKDKNIEIDLYSLPLDDKKVYKALEKGDTSGVFQMEASGFRKILKKLKADKFEDIVAMLSLYRPGPLKSGMVDDFLNAKNRLSEIKYPHPSLEAILKETYGVILYQEQVMKIASYMANYSLGESDLLRRAMGKKNFEIMEKNRAKFVERSIKNGYSKEKAEEIFDLIDKFAGYGFNKSHSVCYAMLSYWTAYFKVNYPQYYYAAVLTSEIMEVDDIAYYFNDAKEHNIKIYSPNVNIASSNFEVKGDGIIFSLAAIKNIGLSLAQKIGEELEENGKYKSLEDFVFRNKKNGLNKKSLEALILSGALDELKGNRKEKFLSVDKVLEYCIKKFKLDEIQQMNLFGGAARTIDSFNLVSSEDYSIDEKLEKEKEFLGFYLSSHPLDKYELIIKLYSLKRLSEYSKINGEKIISFGIVSNSKKIVTKKEERMAIFNLDCYDEKISCIAFPRVYENYQREIMDKNFVYVEGKIQQDEFRGEAVEKLVLNNIVLLEELIKDTRGKLYLLIEPEDSSKYSRLKDLLKQNRGTTKVVFAIRNEEGKSVKNMKEGVKLSKDFIEDLIQLMGIEKVKVIL